MCGLFVVRTYQHPSSHTPRMYVHMRGKCVPMLDDHARRYRCSLVSERWKRPVSLVDSRVTWIRLRGLDALRLVSANDVFVASGSTCENGVPCQNDIVKLS